jgi:hypothetical protein
MNIKDKASKVRQLQNDETFISVIEAVKSKQVAVFLNSNSTEKDREKAHNVICALSEVKDYINSVLTDEKIFDKNN